MITFLFVAPERKPNLVMSALPILQHAFKRCQGRRRIELAHITMMFKEGPTIAVRQAQIS